MDSRNVLHQNIETQPKCAHVNKHLFVIIGVSCNESTFNTTMKFVAVTCLGIFVLYLI